jgi:hypothetical protein
MNNDNALADPSAPAQRRHDQNRMIAKSPAMNWQSRSIAAYHTESNPMNDETETARRARLVEINAKPHGREALEAKHGMVWDTSELADEFEVIGFLAPFVVVRRKSDGAKGSLEFQHEPRFFFNFQRDGRDAMSNKSHKSEELRFDLGRVVATPGALSALEASGQAPGDFLDRHASGDWGDVCKDDWDANDTALQAGSRILSAYMTLRGAKIWIITEAADDEGRRAATTILLPDEY